jgi:hypothetical protein
MTHQEENKLIAEFMGWQDWAQSEDIWTDQLWSERT